MSDIQYYFERQEHRKAWSRVSHLVVSLAHEIDGIRVTPNPPKDTDGRREDSGRVGEGATGEMAGLIGVDWRVGERSSVAA